MRITSHWQNNKDHVINHRKHSGCCEQIKLFGPSQIGHISLNKLLLCFKPYFGPTTSLVLSLHKSEI